jgi:hypothetical protein
MTDDDDALVDRGWMVVDLPDASIVHAVGERLRTQLCTDLGTTLERLEDYHALVADDTRHLEVLGALATVFWNAGLGLEIVRRNLPLFQRLVGLDLHVQTYPYLRAARPRCPQDCTGLHRDTYYGASPFELAALVPFTDITAASGLRVISGSHTEPGTAYPFMQTQAADVAIGSLRHRLGFPYAPRTLDPGLDRRAEPVTLAVGQALLFGLGLVHGGVENTGATTRFSADVRVANSLAPVQWARGVRADYYTPLCSAPMTRLARRYPTDE